MENETDLAAAKAELEQVAAEVAALPEDADFDERLALAEKATVLASAFRMDPGAVSL